MVIRPAQLGWNDASKEPRNLQQPRGREPQETGASGSLPVPHAVWGRGTSCSLLAAPSQRPSPRGDPRVPWDRQPGCWLRERMGHERASPEMLSTSKQPLPR